MGDNGAGAIRVLLIEDEAIVAFDLRRRLQQLGYEIPKVVSTGRDALQALGSARPDVALVDIHIQGDMDGIDTAAQIILQRNIPIVFLTAYSDEPTLERARKTRPHGYLLKPFSERELHATIQMSLERHRMELQLQRSEEHLRLALGAANMTSWDVDPDERCLSVQGTLDFLCEGARDPLQMPLEGFLALVHEEDRAAASAQLESANASGTLREFEFRYDTPGGMRWLRAQGRAIASHSMGARHVVGVTQDITERRQAEERSRLAAKVFDAAREGILIMDAHWRVLSANPGYLGITHWTLPDIEMAPPRVLTSSGRPFAFDDALAAGTLQSNWCGEVFLERRELPPVPALMDLASVTDAGGTNTHYVVVFTDVSEIREAEAQLQHLAHHDPLTDLPNRLLSIDRLEHAIARAIRHGRRGALILLDLDHFKKINDTLGHSAGDELLKALAHRFRHVVREEDTLGRLGGDEFVLVVDQVGSVQDIANITEKLSVTLSEPLNIGGHEIVITASIGIAVFPDNGETVEDLVRAADTAMYASKEAGRSLCSFYNRGMTDAAVRYLARTEELRLALERGQFELFYQPRLSLRTGTVCGAEALLRWRHPERGLLSAGEIIPVAEESGLIVELGSWVLHEACRQLAAWRADGLPPLRLSVNVSVKQMKRQHLADQVSALLCKTGASPAQLEVEVTESMLQDSPECVRGVEELKALGLHVAIDDFGTGYSCMSSLKYLPIDRLKIDRAFITDVNNDPNDAAIVQAIIAMAHRLKISVTAEGVERLEQEQFLRAAGCEEAQGFLYAPALPVADFLRFCNEHR